MEIEDVVSLNNTTDGQKDKCQRFSSHVVYLAFVLRRTHLAFNGCLEVCRKTLVVYIRNTLLSLYMLWTSI
jgi:hypothetical protein